MRKEEKKNKGFNGGGTNGVQLKPDTSVFTIADRIVQNLLVTHLFRPELFCDVIGEEDDSNGSVVITGEGPYSAPRPKKQRNTIPKPVRGTSPS